jgi:hypothetical protein
MSPGEPSRLWRVPWRVIFFMVAFAMLIAFVSRYYLIPALSAAKDATPREKRWLMASSRLLLAVILFIIVAGIFMTFRVGRFFFPRYSRPPRAPTQYIDAWAESAKRLQEPDDDVEENPMSND